MYMKMFHMQRFSVQPDILLERNHVIKFSGKILILV